MNDGILRDIIWLKFKIMDDMIKKLPEPIKGRVKEFERGLLSAVHDASKEYVEKKNGEKEKSNIKPISID